MRFLILLTIFLSTLSASFINELAWPQKETFLTFLERQKIPQNLYYDLDEDDKELVEMIYAGMEYHTLTDEHNKLMQALIPLTEDIQISIYEKNGEYVLDFVPIEYDELRENISFELESSLLQDLKDITGNSKLAIELNAIFKDSIDFRRDLRKGDKISVLYKRKLRLGRTWGIPEVEAAFIETNGKRHYAFFDEKAEGYFDEKAKPIQGMFLRYPLKWTKITSRFTTKRFHPILKTYRPHNGIDYVAPYGSKIWTVANGKVIYAGYKGGYGKTVIIEHKNGYRTKYAHLKGYAAGIRRGAYVKQGQTVGYLGNTGLSTGPHLHFGLYKKRYAINPEKIRGIKKDGLSGKHKKEYLASIAPKMEYLNYYASTQSRGVARVADLDLESGTATQTR